MKLERINENQIRCTLTQKDLASRELKLSELAYGTAKAKALFREMMTQAAEELGFEADNIPLIIEAVPLSNECIMLIITRVTDPEELDTRFAKFSTISEDEEDEEDTETDDNDEPEFGPGDILDIFKQFAENIAEKNRQGNPEDAVPITASDDPSADAQDDDRASSMRMSVYEFDSLSHVSFFCSKIPDQMNCSSILYKNPNTKHFFLVLSSDSEGQDAYQEICALASEFGRSRRANVNSVFYYDEHYEMIIKKDVIGILKNI